METRKELIDLLCNGIYYDIKCDYGKGWEAYEGCDHNLMMCLEDGEPEVTKMKPGDDDYQEGRVTYHFEMQGWLATALVSISFDEEDV